MSANLLTTTDVSTVALDRTVLLAVKVLRADRQARPVFLGPSPLTGSFRRSDDRRRWTTYRLTGVAGEACQASLFDVVRGISDSEREVGESIRSQGDSIRSESLDSIRKAGDSIRSQGDSVRSEPLDSLRSGGDSSESDPQLVAIARPVASRHRAPYAQVREAILQLCRGRYLSAERIGSLLRRNPVRVRHVHLKPLVTAGLLRLRYPGTVNRPDQAYTATDEPMAP